MANAENAMYMDKTMNRKFSNKDIIDTIIKTLHTKNPAEKQHSISVSALCSDVWDCLTSSETEISKLKRAGYLHDIGKIVLDRRKSWLKIPCRMKSFEKCSSIQQWDIES